MVSLQYPYNMQYARKALHFSELVEFKKLYVRFLINETFTLAGNILKVEKEEKYFMKYFFSGLMHLNRNLKETSQDILFFF